MSKPETRGGAMPQQRRQEPEKQKPIPEDIEILRDELFDPTGIFFQQPEFSPEDEEILDELGI